MAENKSPYQNLEDPGFGTQSTSYGRLILPDGSYNVQRKGVRYYDAYMWLIDMSWKKFFSYLFLGYVALNLIFALLFYLNGIEQIGGTITNAAGSDFLESFFFSIQTFATIGYGYLSPLTKMANFIASLDAFVGLIYAALATGMFFARFANPGASIRFSDHVVICDHKEGRAFMFRIVNLHQNKITNLEAEVMVTYIVKQGGKLVRKYGRLPLEISRLSMFPLNWTVVHPINEESILHGKTKKELSIIHIEFIILIKGHDETYGRMVSASRSYTCDEVIANRKFKMMYEDQNGHIVLHLDQINQLQD